MSLPPGPRTPAPLNALRYVRDPLGLFPRLRRRHGDVFRVSFPGYKDIVYLADPVLVRELFTGDPARLHAGEANATVLEPAVGPASVLVLDDARHLEERKLLLPAFHGRALDGHRAVFAEAAARDLATWPVGRPFALHEHMRSITLEVILRAVFGVRDPARLARASVVIGAFSKRSDALNLPGFLRRDLGRRSPWARFLRARAALDAFVRDELALRRADPEAETHDDVLSLLLRARFDDGRALTDDELRDELVTVVGAGHETTATALTWALERLMRHPAALDRLRATLAEGDTAYLDAVIRETLRVRPVIADVGRLLKAPLEIAGYRLPEGTMLLASITGIHFREDLYPDPWAFRPERFLEGQPSTYMWIPFGGGVRRCLGAAFAQEEMRVVLREIVARADLRPDGAADERPRLRNVTLTPHRGGRAVLTAWA